MWGLEGVVCWHLGLLQTLRGMQVMHAYQEWVQQYQTANKSVLESARQPMGAVGAGGQEPDPRELAGDLPSGSLEVLTYMQSIMNPANALV